MQTRAHECTDLWPKSQAYPLLTTLENKSPPAPSSFLTFLFVSIIFFFFKKKDLSKYLDNKSFAFPKKLFLFFFSLVVFADF